MKKIYLLLLLIHTLIAQNVPFISDHPVYHFLQRHESLGHIDAENWSTRPFTYTQINEMLNEIGTHRAELTLKDRSILLHYQKELNREISEEGIIFPWTRNNYRRLLTSDSLAIEPFFMTYKQKEASGWINWSETFRLQMDGENTRGYYTDHLGIYGVVGSIAFTTQYTYHRLTRNEAFSSLPESYKEGYILDREYIEWITWDYPTSSLTYTHKDFNIGIHRQPIYWGYSPDNSPILSNNVNPLPHVDWSIQLPHLRYKFIHARLSPNDPLQTDTTNTRRNLSAHRVEFDLNPNFEFAFNEMVIYAYRDFELGYLNPVNFLFAEEHLQGDLDNLLMALDFKWRITPGLTTYGTWFFDELDFFKLFSGWWGNKFVFQVGATYYPTRNLPSLNIEYTAARPWTYSHHYPVNSFTSSGRVLGFPVGPNSKQLSIHTQWQLYPTLHMSGAYNHTIVGNYIGNDPLADYTTGDHEFEEEGDFVLGELHKDDSFKISIDYYMTPYCSIIASYQNHPGPLLIAGWILSW